MKRVKELGMGERIVDKYLETPKLGEVWIGSSVEMTWGLSQL